MTKPNIIMLSGKEVFQLMDSHGVPLDLINEVLREKHLCFNVLEFVQAALDSKNFTYQSIRRRLLDSMLPEERDEFTIELDSRCLKS